jgi:hypothetical protein
MADEDDQTPHVEGLEWYEARAYCPYPGRRNLEAAMYWAARDAGKDPAR